MADIMIDREWLISQGYNPDDFTPVSNNSLDLMHDMTGAEFKITIVCAYKPDTYQSMTIKDWLEVTGLSQTGFYAGVKLVNDRGLYHIPIMEKAGYLYLIRAGDTNYYKLGQAKDPQSRKRELQTGNHLHLTIEFMIFSEKAIELEREVITFLNVKNKHVRGEWYLLDESTIEELEERFND